MKDIIIYEITRNKKSSYAADGLDYKSIKSNIVLITQFVKNDAKLRKVFSKGKEIWLIKLRLGLINEPMLFEDIASKFTDKVKKIFRLGTLSNVEIEETLRKKFAIYIRRINNAIIRDELHIQRDRLKSCQLKVQKLTKENTDLTNDNIDLLNALELQEKQSIEIFKENVLLKVKKYLDK